MISAPLLLHLCHFLWVSGIVSQLPANLILAIASQSTLSILGLTETWICPEDSATPAVLSNNFPFSHLRNPSKTSKLQPSTSKSIWRSLTLQTSTSTPSFIRSQMAYHHKHQQIRQPAWLNLHMQLYHRQHLVKPLDISAHFFIIFNLNITTCVPPITLPVTLSKTYVPFTLPSFPCSVILSSLTHLFLISGCKYSKWHFMIHFNFIEQVRQSKRTPIEVQVERKNMI